MPRGRADRPRSDRKLLRALCYHLRLSDQPRSAVGGQQGSAKLHHLMCSGRRGGRKALDDGRSASVDEPGGGAGLHNASIAVHEVLLHGFG